VAGETTTLATHAQSTAKRIIRASVSRLATSRLIEASATLDAADQAFLDIWVKRGLDDAALARMTGMSEEAIAGRRARIVEHLSAALGLTPENVRSALSEIADSPEVHSAAAVDAPAARADAPVANGTAPAPELVTPSANGTAPALELSPPVTPSTNGPAPLLPSDTPDTETTEAAALEPDAGSSSRRRRWLWSALALFVIVIAAVVLVVSLASSGSGHHRVPAPHPAPASTQTVSPPSTTAPASSPTASRLPREPLVALAPGPDQATGAVLITRKGPNLTLNLSVSKLPAASHGHYEVWLYDSLITSEPVGRLRTGVRRVSLRLPADAARYHWIDISFQPVGHVFHSGESVLRSVNPVFATP
jgi:hypothetical protein